MNFSNQIHPDINTNSAISNIWVWMLRNWHNHLNEDGTVNAETLTEQSALEFDLDPAITAKLANEIKDFADEVAA